MRIIFVSMMIHDEAGGFLHQSDGIDKRSTGIAFETKQEALEHQINLEDKIKNKVEKNIRVGGVVVTIAESLEGRYYL